jgi:hypothetical protein
VGPLDSILAGKLKVIK